MKSDAGAAVVGKVAAMGAFTEAPKNLEFGNSSGLGFGFRVSRFRVLDSRVQGL